MGKGMVAVLRATLGFEPEIMKQGMCENPLLSLGALV